MDRKFCWKWKHLLFCVASVTCMSLASCATVQEPVTAEGPALCPHQEFLLGLSAAPDFEAAVRDNQEILSSSPKTPPADEAMFNLGLIYAHPDYPRKDYRKSLGYFRRLLREYPQSAFAGEARIWAGILEDMEKVTKVDKEIEEKKKELGK